jgi:pimeloyl-ACP methyl ester carboxylesterase
VELTYPRTLDWSLQDYAAGVERALAAVEIGKGWILGESFGSQVSWPLAARKRFGVEGLVLAGGFGKHPTHWGVVLSQKAVSAIPLGIITRALLGAPAYQMAFPVNRGPREREGIYRTSPELDRRAAAIQQLIEKNDPSIIIQRLDVPLCAVSGALDPSFPAWRSGCNKTAKLENSKLSTQPIIPS